MCFLFDTFANTFAHIFFPEQNGKMPLHFAARFGHVDIVRELLSAQAMVDVCDTEVFFLFFFVPWKLRSEL